NMSVYMRTLAAARGNWRAPAGAHSKGLPMSPNTNELLSPKDVAHHLGITRRTLRRWTVTGYFPAPIRLNGRTLRWEPRTGRDWLLGQQEGRPCSRTA